MGRNQARSERVATRAERLFPALVAVVLCGLAHASSATQNEPTVHLAFEAAPWEAFASEETPEPLARRVFILGEEAEARLPSDNVGIAAIAARAYPTQADEAGWEAWEAFVRETVRNAARAGANRFELAPGAAAGRTAEEYAYFIKRTAVAGRGEAPDARFVMGEPFSGIDASWLEDVYRRDAGSYVHGVAVKDASRVAGLRAALDRANPKAEIWLVEQEHQSAGTILRAWLRSIADGASVAAFKNLSEEEAGPVARAWALVAGGGFVPVPRAYDRHQVTSTEEDARPFHAAFHNERENAYLVAFFAASAERGEADASVHAVFPAIRDAKRIDVFEDSSEFMRFVIGVPARNASEILTSFAPYPVFMSYALRVEERLGEARERVEVRGRAEMPVEEIIARHQVFDRRERARVRHYAADGRMDLHARIAEFRASLDITTLNRFYSAKETGMEWEQREAFVNGARWRSPQLPEIPLVQPEKAAQVPLDLAFDKRYGYRLLGRESVDGRECYKVAFRPLDDTLSLHEGAVWIDTETFAKLKISAAQTRLEKPVVSNTETNFFGEVVAADGEKYWLLRRIEGQMVFTTAGRNTVLERKVEFSNFDVNSPRFEEERRASYESEHQMLRDTEKGFRYLVKDESGERVVKEEATRDSLLLLFGVYYDPSLDFPIPLAGVNYFSFDFMKTGTQVNLFFAGVLGTLTAARPSLFGTKLEAGLDVFALGIAAEDRYYVGGVESETERVKSRQGEAQIFLSLPFAHYYKVTAGYGAGYERFEESNETDPTFVLPQDTLTHSARLAARFDRKGWNFSAFASTHRRGDWEMWGIPGNPGYDPEHESYKKYGVSFAKTFHLPHFQKIGVSLDGMAGSDLDRFSSYRVSYFGARVRGFGGSGIRFDRGAAASLAYTFGVSDALRFEAAVDAARTRDSSASPDYARHVGASVSANFLGPWGTLIQTEAAYGISSDIEPAEGEWEGRIFVLKLFDRKKKGR